MCNVFQAECDALDNNMPTICINKILSFSYIIKGETHGAS